ncbi:hypothetical protein XHC_3577 [Xanthomonas hortorum pv. carotae str. M081]|nr:hypothetical protein XHC_3577 [Xanthomonas hortorum pv. carotae str. M081]
MSQRVIESRQTGGDAATGTWACARVTSGAVPAAS